MSINQSFLAELAHEGAATRRILERIPDAKADFTPHPKSFTLGKLGVHVADMYNWIPATVNASELDFSKGNPQPSFTTTAKLVAMLDRNLAEAATALANASDETLMGPWSLRNGEHIFFTMPRVQVLRSMVFNHIVHHRAQITVYLRMLDVPVPGLYGPSADER